MADYVTKHHLTIHHQATRGTFLTDITKLIELKNQQKVSDKTITSCSKSVLNSSGLPESARAYETALEARKLLSASDLHGNRRLCERTTQVLMQPS